MDHGRIVVHRPSLAEERSCDCEAVAPWGDAGGDVTARGDGLNACETMQEGIASSEYGVIRIRNKSRTGVKTCKFSSGLTLEPVVTALASASGAGPRPPSIMTIRRISTTPQPTTAGQNIRSRQIGPRRTGLRSSSSSWSCEAPLALRTIGLASSSTLSPSVSFRILFSAIRAARPR